MRTRNTGSVSLISAAFISFVFSCLKLASANRTTLYIDEVHGLSELPMSELIHIRSSLVEEEDIFDGDDYGEASSRMLSVSLPMALPLKRNAKRNNERPLRRYSEHYEEKGKGDTKISKIFQLAVTALSFLAFGGYLLTLIIMAIRRNSGGGNNGNVIVLSALCATIVAFADVIFLYDATLHTEIYRDCRTTHGRSGTSSILQKIISRSRNSIKG